MSRKARLAHSVCEQSARVHTIIILTRQTSWWYYKYCNLANNMYFNFLCMIRVPHGPNSSFQCLFQLECLYTIRHYTGRDRWRPEALMLACHV